MGSAGGRRHGTHVPLPSRAVGQHHGWLGWQQSVMMLWLDAAAACDSGATGVAAMASCMAFTAISHAAHPSLLTPLYQVPNPLLLRVRQGPNLDGQDPVRAFWLALPGLRLMCDTPARQAALASVPLYSRA